ncbi:MAG: hypothetical protein ACW9W3_04980 [Candidatus Nitrosopumilus sp. bin_68KS]
MKQDSKTEWSEKHNALLKKVMMTSGKPMGFKSPDSILKHLESLGNRS